MPSKTPRLKTTWTKFIADEEWAAYEAAIHVVRKAKVEFLIAGAFGLAVYTGRWRNTKDLDLLILPKDREAIVQALADAGFVDYYDQLAYDRGWIYRSTRDGFIVDVIWAMANRRAQVDELWFDRAPLVTIRTEQLRIVPAEELLWHKLYVLQRERCDWPDVWNLLYKNGPTLDWEHLLNRIGNDTQLLQAALLVFNWICPDVANEFPDWVRERFQLPKRDAENNLDWKKNVSLLDSRPWFAGLEPESKESGS
ncbi:MAG: nucleotidyltransferase family protein, partial [Verrucomicrobiota bacterium]